MNSTNTMLLYDRKLQCCAIDISCHYDARVVSYDCIVILRLSTDSKYHRSIASEPFSFRKE